MCPYLPGIWFGTPRGQSVREFWSVGAVTQRFPVRLVSTAAIVARPALRPLDALGIGGN